MAQADRFPLDSCFAGDEVRVVGPISTGTELPNPLSCDLQVHGHAFLFAGLQTREAVAEQKVRDGSYGELFPKTADFMGSRTCSWIPPRRDRSGAIHSKLEGCTPFSFS